MAELLDGKVAIVSGVGPGLGTAICGALREHGAQLVVGDLDARGWTTRLRNMGPSAK